jgi:hypothetical protein
MGMITDPASQADGRLDEMCGGYNHLTLELWSQSLTMNSGSAFTAMCFWKGFSSLSLSVKWR